LRAETPTDRTGWTAAFLTASASKAEDWLQLFMDLELAWFAARATVAGRRRHSRAGADRRFAIRSGLYSNAHGAEARRWGRG
jgi:hypothetical protein